MLLNADYFIAEVIFLCQVFHSKALSSCFFKYFCTGKQYLKALCFLSCCLEKAGKKCAVLQHEV